MSKTGSVEERDLVNKLWAAGYAAMRAPASGGATKRPLPDVLAGNGKKYLAIEVKSTRQDHIYIDNEKITNLIKFSEIFGATPYVGAKFIRKAWRFIKLEDLHVTRSENYRVNTELAFSKGLDFEEIIGESIQTKLL
ncbi:Holliday junction resolvase Hjc [Methanosphaera sp. WGK6]|uniref:Holliday junction resolvase Hjc n=1 Tax=Methanosphaera sp. WGK6 TaxID=1561964 RepID=UPI00084C9B6C|nr:Holliday junction resolvase Hjc [Methanosphaera sp. WGK6]OED29957.1 Holliday junction resolvase [Methanosphaera sp. WGK6]